MTAHHHGRHPVLSAAEATRPSRPAALGLAFVLLGPGSFLGCTKAPVETPAVKKATAPAKTAPVKAPHAKAKAAPKATPRTDPLAGKTVGQICLSSALLLTRYSAKTLYGTPLPGSCCAPVVLPEAEAWRCELDWPSSDVPSCSLWSELRKELLAAHAPATGDALPAMVRDNLATLLRWHTTKHGCDPTSPN